MATEWDETFVLLNGRGAKSLEYNTHIPIPTPPLRCRWDGAVHG